MKRCDLDIRRSSMGSRDVGLVPRTPAGEAFYRDIRALRPLDRNLVPGERLPELFTRLFDTHLSFAVYQL